MPADLKLLGGIIREQREKRQLSQEHLAALAGLSRTYLGEVERGAANMSFTSLVAIADGLGMELSEILGDYDKRVG